MKHLLLPLLAAITLPNTVNANVSPEVHNICRDVSDYLGCVKANQVEDSLRNKNEEVILYENPFNSSQSCVNEAIDRDLDPNIYCPPCGGGVPMGDRNMEASANGECILSNEQVIWSLKKLGCGFLGIYLLNPQFIGNAFDNNSETCFD